MRCMLVTCRQCHTHHNLDFDADCIYLQDLIVGKSDGNIEVYAYDDGDDSEPILKFAYVSDKQGNPVFPTEPASTAILYFCFCEIVSTALLCL